MSDRDNRGRFVKGSSAAMEAGRKGGMRTPSLFREGDPRTVEAGRKGGKASRRAAV
jgi:uncharacterized protein